MGLCRRRCFTILLVLGLWGPGHLSLAAAPLPAVALETVLAAEMAPPGVVFEIVDRDEAALKRALPWVVGAAQRLRARFPQLQMAVVSHGREMFALREQSRGEHAEVHDLAQRLGQEQGIPINVCETHAGWRGVMPEDFPKYIDVAPTGPTQVRNYMDLGYVLVKVPRAAVLGKTPGS